MARAVDSPRVVNIADLRLMAERRMPRAVFDYIDGGADAEFTLRENCRVFDDVILRPRNAVAIPQCDLHVTVLGQRLELPFLLAPVGSSRMFYPRGEEAAARAAGAAGTAYILSTLSGCRLEDVKAGTYRLLRIFRPAEAPKVAGPGAWQNGEVTVTVVAGKETAVPPRLDFGSMRSPASQLPNGKEKPSPRPAP